MPSLSLHEQTLEKSFIHSSVGVKQTNERQLQRYLAQPYPIHYIIGHSNIKKGVQLGDKWVSADTFKMRSQDNKIRTIFLNTCYGIETGLAQAAIDSGAKTVIAASGKIPVKYMTQYAEAFFEKWTQNRVQVKDAIEATNAEYEDKDIQFTLLGNGRLLFN